MSYEPLRDEIQSLRQTVERQAAQIEMMREALERTHELYAQASSGYGFATPENPHNFIPDMENCSAKEIENHSKACSYYDDGIPIVNRQWGIGTYFDEFKPALKALATTPDQAIEQFAARVRKQCADALDPDKYPNECDKSMVHNCRLAIRAITELPK